MVFPLARDLVACIRQVCREVRWEVLATELLQRELSRLSVPVTQRYWRAKGTVWIWVPTLRHLCAWTRELRRRSRFLQNNYGDDEVVDDQIRALVIRSEGEWARLAPVYQPEWDRLGRGGVILQEQPRDWP